MTSPSPPPSSGCVNFCGAPWPVTALRSTGRASGNIFSTQVLSQPPETIYLLNSCCCGVMVHSVSGFCCGVFSPKTINLSNCRKTFPSATFRASVLPFGIATALYLTVWVLDASQHWSVAFSIQCEWRSKGRAFQEAFISKINQIFFFANVLVCICVHRSDAPVTQLKKSGSSFSSVIVLL